MIHDVLIKIAIIIAEIAILLLLFEVVYFIQCIMADLQLKYFAKINKLDFELGKYGFGLLLSNRTSRIIGTLNEQRFVITYSHGFGRSAIPSRLQIEVYGENLVKGRLNIRNRSRLHRFEKKRLYFGDEWDNKLVVESSPVAFGKHIFASKQLREKFYSNVNFLNLFFGDSIRIKITRSGIITVSIPASIVNPSRINEVLSVAMEISKLVTTYQP
jgi:hypothetical protein